MTDRANARRLRRLESRIDRYRRAIIEAEARRAEALVRVRKLNEIRARLEAGRVS